jgi:hypothetical protein
MIYLSQSWVSMGVGPKEGDEARVCGRASGEA